MRRAGTMKNDKQAVEKCDVVDGTRRRFYRGVVHM